MTQDSDQQSILEFVLELVKDRVEADPHSGQMQSGNAWTSRGMLRQRGDEFAQTPYNKEELSSAIDDLVEAGKLVEWHGLLAPATEEHIRALIESEHNADVTRKILVGQLNERLQEVTA